MWDTESARFEQWKSKKLDFSTENRPDWAPNSAKIDMFGAAQRAARVQDAPHRTSRVTRTHGNAARAETGRAALCGGWRAPKPSIFRPFSA